MAAARSAALGFSRLRALLGLLLALLLIGAAWFWWWTERQHERICEQHLLRIYTLLEMYEIDRGTLPRLAFFPDDPRQDNDSIVVVLAPYGAEADDFICPATPKLYRDTGLSYLWNVKLNGRKQMSGQKPEWMLVELNALSREVPPPHLNCYHILYTDGRVVHAKTPPPELLLK